LVPGFGGSACPFGFGLDVSPFCWPFAAILVWMVPLPDVHYYGLRLVVVVRVRFLYAQLETFDVLVVFALAPGASVLRVGSPVVPRSFFAYRHYFVAAVYRTAAAV
jgi:hypothetical protein